MADWLAKGGVAKELEGVWINQPPDAIRPLIHDDLGGRTFMKEVRVVI